jgi:AraC-like DNA-binding protein
MADGCTEMLFHYEGRFNEVTKQEKTEKSFLSGIHGQSRQHRRFIINRSFGIFGVYFYPYALPVLFNTPAVEVSDQMPDLRSFLGVEGNDLEEKIMTAKNNEERVGILSQYLMWKLRQSKKPFPHLHSIIKKIINMNGQIDVKQLAADSFLSVRQFERRFKELSGFSPKLYSRITRFQSVFHQFSSRKVNLSQIAYQCGYYDQSHFIQEFREFSGYNPREFLSDNKSDTTIWTE